MSSIFVPFVSHKQQLQLVYFRYANEIMLPWWWDYLCIQSLPNCCLWSRETWKQASSKGQQRFCNPHFSSFLCLLLHLQPFVSSHCLKVQPQEKRVPTPNCLLRDVIALMFFLFTSTAHISSGSQVSKTDGNSLPHCGRKWYLLLRTK